MKIPKRFGIEIPLRFTWRHVVVKHTRAREFRGNNFWTAQRPSHARTTTFSTTSTIIIMILKKTVRKRNALLLTVEKLVVRRAHMV